MLSTKICLGVISFVSLTLVGALAPAAAQDVVIASAGGVAQDAQREALFKPVAAALGLTFAEDTSTHWGQAKAQVDSGAVTWDIAQFSMFESQLAAEAGTIIKLPDNIVNREDFVPGTVSDYCVGITIYSTNIAYSTEAYGGSGPQNYVEFWDVEKFPGKRGMYRSPRGNVEAAVMAMGHPMEEVYQFLSTPEGRQAAIDKIAELKDDAVWWESGAQSAQLVQDGEVPLITAWNGRLQAAIDAGAPYKINFNQGGLENGCWGVLKGAPHEENAIKFVAEMSKAEYAKDIVKYIAYGSANLKAYEGYDEATLARLTSSPQNVSVQYTVDVDFWAKYGPELSEAFDTMLLSN